MILLTITNKPTVVVENSSYADLVEEMLYLTEKN